LRRLPTIGPVGNGGSATVGFVDGRGSSFASAAFNGFSRGECGNPADERHLGGQLVVGALGIQRCARTRVTWLITSKYCSS
jgi:hypothetical protein